MVSSDVIAIYAVTVKFDTFVNQVAELITDWSR